MCQLHCKTGLISTKNHLCKNDFNFFSRLPLMISRPAPAKKAGASAERNIKSFPRRRGGELDN